MLGIEFSEQNNKFKFKIISFNLEGTLVRTFFGLRLPLYNG